MLNSFQMVKEPRGGGGGLKIAFEISFSCGDAVSQRVSGTVSSNE